MITAVFRPDGFSITGHSGYARHGSDIVCAAVSSAAYMTANTITDVFHSDAEASESDGEMNLVVKDGGENALGILEGFRLHMEQLREQYPRFIKIISEV